MKRTTLLAAAIFCLLLCGCASIRARVPELPEPQTQTTASPQISQAPQQPQNTPQPTPEATAQPTPEPTPEVSPEPEPDPLQEPDPQPEPTPPQELPPEPDTAAPENPEAAQKQYDSSASAELNQDVEAPAENPVPEADTPAEGGANGDGETVIQETDIETEHTVTETLQADSAEELSAAEQAPAAETALQYYQALLSSRIMELFECEKLDVYWETVNDHETIFRDSAAHQVILLAGGYDVSAKLLEDALTVDDGWICRKNPGAVVKCVDGPVLGSGVLSDVGAREVRAQLLSRDGWSGIGAGKAGIVVVISSELLRSAAGQTAAAVYLAAAMYPELMADTDPAEALQALLTESAGTAPTGMYAYIG